jgi:CRISPR/Cas system type I-B associated protein Csh2 (Cas7 group RAMP superfamily)
MVDQVRGAMKKVSDAVASGVAMSSSGSQSGYFKENANPKLEIINQLLENNKASSKLEGMKRLIAVCFFFSKQTTPPHSSLAKKKTNSIDFQKKFAKKKKKKKKKKKS